MTREFDHYLNSQDPTALLSPTNKILLIMHTPSEHIKVRDPVRSSGLVGERGKPCPCCVQERARPRKIQGLPAVGQTLLTSFLSLSAYLSNREEYLSNSFQIKFRFN